MQPGAPEISTCPTCGGSLEKTPDGGPGCMVCLLRAGIGGEEEVAQDSTPNAFDGGERFGVYEIEDGSLYEPGRGARGVTYRATDTMLQRKVALNSRKESKLSISGRHAAMTLRLADTIRICPAAADCFMPTRLGELRFIPT